MTNIDLQFLLLDAIRNPYMTQATANDVLFIHLIQGRVNGYESSHW